jgi:hypothetical protein
MTPFPFTDTSPRCTGSPPIGNDVVRTAQPAHQHHNPAVSAASARQAGRSSRVTADGATSARDLLLGCRGTAVPRKARGPGEKASVLPWPGTGPGRPCKPAAPQVRKEKLRHPSRASGRAEFPADRNTTHGEGRPSHPAPAREPRAGGGGRGESLLPEKPRAAQTRKRKAPLLREAFHRDSGIRTHDLLNPIQVRYQLRYVPGAGKDSA